MFKELSSVADGSQAQETNSSIMNGYKDFIDQQEVAPKAIEHPKHKLHSDQVQKPTKKDESEDDNCVDDFDFTKNDTKCDLL
jgi:hypothetical protein